MAVYLKHVWPEVKIIGVEPADAACALAARENGSRVTLDEVGLFADGCAVARVGEETHRVISHTSMRSLRPQPMKCVPR